MNNLKKQSLLFVVGGLVYSTLEIIFRGYTHWSMTILGGICLIVLNKIEEIFGKAFLVKKCVLGSAVITTLEFVVGCIVNIRCRWNVWDYSAIPLNYMGQICLPFTVLWFFICIPGFQICEFLKKKVLIKIK